MSADASRTLIQAGTWLLNQDSAGVLTLRGPGNLTGVELTAGSWVEHETGSGVAIVVTPTGQEVTVEVPESDRQRAPSRHFPSRPTDEAHCPARQ